MIWRSLVFLLLTLSCIDFAIAGDRAQEKDPWIRDTVNFIVDGGGEYIVNNAYVFGGCADDKETDKPGLGRGPDRSGLDLQGSDWSNKNLANVRFVGSDLGRANLTNTDLRFAFLSNASLDNSALRNANMAGASLQGASLKGADLEGVILFDGDVSSSSPVSFFRKWKSITLDLDLPDGTYVDHLRLELCSGRAFLTFLLFEGNGANVEGADFTDAKNLSARNVEYICRWGGEQTRKTLGAKCKHIPRQQENPYEATITDTFEAIPQLVDLPVSQSGEAIDHWVVVEFSDPVMLRSDAFELRSSQPTVSVPMCLNKQDENQQLFFFRATRSLIPGQTYEVVLLSGKALDNGSNLLRGDRVLGRLQIPSLTYSSPETLVPDAVLHTHLLAGRDAYEKAHYAESNRHFALVLTEAENFGPVNDHVIRSLSQLAAFYLDHGRHVEAMPFYKRVQEMLQSPDKSCDQKLPQSLFRVAFLLYSHGKYTDSEFFYHQALAMFQKHLGFEHPNVALALNNLAKIYHVQKYYDQALPLYQRSLVIFEKTVGSEQPSVGHVLNNLALLQCGRGKYAEAEAFVLRSLKIREKLLGLSHPSVGESLKTYAEVLRKLNRSTEAFEVETRAKAIQTKCAQGIFP